MNNEDIKYIYEKSGMIMSNAIIAHGKEYDIVYPLEKIGKAIYDMGTEYDIWLDIENVKVSDTEEEILQKIDQQVYLCLRNAKFDEDDIENIQEEFRNMLTAWRNKVNAKAEKEKDND